MGVSFSPDGSLWLGSTTDGSVLIYDTDTGEKICSLKGGDVWEVGQSEAMLIHPKIKDSIKSIWFHLELLMGNG